MCVYVCVCEWGGGAGKVNESVKKGKFVTKIFFFFSDNFEWSSKKLWKIISADVRAKYKTIKNKLTGVCMVSVNFYTFKTCTMY